MRVLISASLAVALTLSQLSGCWGGGSRVQSNISTTTEGQQLIDLKKAYDEGAISETEYERKKKQILKRR